MKTVLQRTLSIALICLTLFLVMSPAWLNIDNVKSRHLRAKKQDLKIALENTKEHLLNNLYEYEEVLDDNNLPDTRGSIKSSLSSIEKNVGELFNKEISLKELYNLSKFVPKLSNLADNFLSLSPYVAEEILESSGDKITYEQIENLSDTLYDKLYIFKLIKLLFILLFIIAIAAIITIAINKFNFFKYIFFVFVVSLAAAFIVISIFSGDILAEMNLPMNFDEMTLKFTWAPIAAVITALASLLVPLFFKNKKSPTTVNVNGQKGDVL